MGGEQKEYQESASFPSGRLIMQNKELAGSQRTQGIGSAIIIHELDFKHTRTKRFHHRAHLPAQQTPIRHILYKRDHIEHVNVLGHNADHEKRTTGRGKKR